MSLQCILQSQSVNYERDSFSASAIYHIYDDAGSQVTAEDVMTSVTVATVLGTGAGSALRSFGNYLSGNGTGVAAYAKLRYSGYTLKNDEGLYHWTMTVNFDSAASDSSPSGAAKDAIPENTPGFTAIEMNIEAAVVPTYRVGSVTMPTGTAIDNPTEVDIAGTPIDQGGESVDAYVSTVKFTLRTVVRGRPSSTILNNISNQTNTRNNAAFSIASFSCPAGSLLFTGAQVSRTGANTYEITYNFAYDDEFHLRQLAKVDLNGKPVVGVLSSGAISTVEATINTQDAAAPQGHAPRYAAHVMWKQPFKTTTNFSSLFADPTWMS